MADKQTKGRASESAMAQHPIWCALPGAGGGTAERPRQWIAEGITEAEFWRRAYLQARTEAAVPVEWAPKEAVLRAFRLPTRKLRELRLDGIVRSVKWGDSRQATRVYCIDDVRRALFYMAQGRALTGPPRRK